MSLSGCRSPRSAATCRPGRAALLHGTWAVVLSLLAVPAARAQVEASVQHFDDGNARFTQGDYRGALAFYEQALAAGHASGALYYNMGNAYYRLDEIGQAIRYYEKARALMPEQRELLHNLEIARGRTADQLSQLPEPFWRPWWRGLLRTAGADGLFAAGLLFYLAAAALAGVRIWSGPRGDWHRRALAAAAAAAVLFLGLGTAGATEPQRHRRAVVVAPAAGLHEGPERTAPTALDVHEGLVVDVLRARDAWLEVRLPNGATGWIEAQAVGEI